MEPSTAPPTASSSNLDPAERRPEFKPIQEIRFAVVMYGGVSLAIYINGVAQELLRLVRATAPEKPFKAMEAAAADQPLRALLADAELRGTEKVYRRLGQRLPLGRQDRDEDGNPPAIRTRFVVDIISGTSAGGINGIFLAKALACNLSIGSLRDLWVNEGDIGKLLNDSLSYKDLPGMDPQRPPRSLLNSRRMYYKLLHALEGMDQQASPGPSCMVDELDLFVTTTDIEGLVAPIRLADRVVHERRHRKVFPFRYATQYSAGVQRNDFERGANPFLAFAARCTSSFPFAFEPMRLDDIDGVLDLPAWSGGDYEKSSSASWHRFFPEYLNVPTSGNPDVRERQREERAAAFLQNAFGDGGYLDNKPFSYAIEAFRQRRADLPVDRKLLYVEPSPEHPELDRRSLDRPDALRNVRKALLELPRYETIREDVEAVRSYNQLVERVRIVLSGRDLEAARTPLKPLPHGQIRQMGITEMVAFYGASYGAYHRLRVAYVSDELARLVARLSGFDEDSDERLAIRYLISAWRNRHYVPYKEPGRETENEFLFRLDLWWRLRRLSFLQSRIDELHAADLEELNERLRPLAAQWSDPDLLLASREEQAAFCQALRLLKSGLSDLFVRLRTTARDLRSTAQADQPETQVNKAAEAMARLTIDRDTLLAILERPADEARWQAAEKLLAQVEGPFEEFAKAVSAKLSDTLGEVGVDGEHLLGIPRPGTRPTERIAGLLPRLDAVPAAAKARQVIAHYHRHYEHYDLVAFPVLYETGAAEASEVDILRVSPEDASDLYDERGRTRRGTPDEIRELGKDRVPAGRGEPKLAGTSFGHFGAFLREDWRVGDIVWGRLDGAERILAALLPDPGDAEQNALRQSLLVEAQHEILKEELEPAQKRALGEVLRTLQAELAKLSPEERARLESGQGQTAIQRWMLAMTAPGQETRLQRAVESFLEPDRLAESFIESTQSNRALPPEPALRSAARATEVVGQILEDLADTYNASGGIKRWIGMVTWLGRLFWGLVEVSVPRSAWNLLFRHWLSLLVAFELFLIAGGLILGREGAAQFGWTALGITVGLYLFQYILGGILAGRKRRVLKTVGVVIVGGLAVYGGWTLWGQSKGWMRVLRDGIVAKVQAILPGGARPAPAPPRAPALERSRRVAL
jgi:patatin-related protein